MLNVGQRHRRRASINPALIQSIFPVQPACRYRQHEALTRAEWILASTGDAGPTFNRHWVGVGLYSSINYPGGYITSLGLPDQGAIERRWWASIGPALGQSLVFAGSVDMPHSVSHIGVVPKRNNKFRLKV